MFKSPAELHQALANQFYLADESTVTVLFLAARLQKPLLIEGPAGVGKTGLALALAASQGFRLIRLQCYEGIDAGKALYDWNYHRQLLRVQAGQGEGWENAGADIFTREFLMERPLLQAILSTEPCLLLIDELDKSGEEFESFLLELLAEFQITIPELGTLQAAHKPLVMLTSNGSRDFSDALRRRCLHLHLGYPDMAREAAIVAGHCPEVRHPLINHCTNLVHRLRKLPLRKSPSIAETIDFVQALVELGFSDLTKAAIEMSLGTLLKYPQDQQLVMERLPGLMELELS
ncbi:MAG: MoxR family ATPase [Peptococcaceae bacterium]|nr:MoxR family ATPase [Peptococcaceae bacterium]